MFPVDEIAQKRQDAANLKASQDNHQQSLDAIRDSGIEVVGALQGTAKSADIGQIIQELRQIQLDTLMSAQQQSHAVAQPTVILTDQTDLGDKLIAIGDKISETVSKLDSAEHDSAEIDELKQLNRTLQDFIKAHKEASLADIKADKALLTAIKSLKLSPVVNVPQPKVAVTTQHVDLQPLQDTIREYLKQDEPEDSIDLDDYRAQDINNSDPKMQYVGFVNPDGNWYIIENDVANNKMRYLFGMDNYEQAFSRAASFTYSLLNEAINAITT